MSALLDRMAGVRNYESLFAWQLAEQFHQQVLTLVRHSSAASCNYGYRDQLLNASSDVSKDICEGFLRCSPLVFANFLGYALGSLGEAERRLKDGLIRGYFSQPECAEALLLARRCFTAIIRLKQSQIRYAKERPKKR
jgi:four helix bundle protein